MNGDPNDPIGHGSRRLMSRAMYAKLKAMVDSWEREERAREKIAARAIGSFIILAVASVAAYRFLPYFFDLLLWGGFVAWIAYVILLMRRHLARGS